MSDQPGSNGELILYQSDDGMTRVQLRALDGTVWLTQIEIADLFATTKQNVSLHLKNLLANGELEPQAVVKESLTTAADGKAYLTKLYNLEAILAIGYRVRSVRGTQFRQWATTRLRDYLIKGFVIDERRLSDPGPFDYFDELLEKIREIRASEKRFYQKVRDIYATSIDYDVQTDRAQTFFATVQNKMLHAITGATAAELIVARAAANKPNMGLTAWKGERVRKGDVTTAKNYLAEDEVRQLNAIVSTFLDVAEQRAERRTAMTMAEWEAEVDKYLRFMERPVLADAGRISRDAMERIAHDRYQSFDASRRVAESAAAEADHAQELKRIEQQATANRRVTKKPPKGSL
jgi:hypothetical protein